MLLSANTCLHSIVQYLLCERHLGFCRVVYNSDPSNTTRHLSHPVAQPDELRRIVRLYAREGQIDTLVQEVFSQAMTHFWRTDKCPYDVRPHHQRLVPMMDDGLGLRGVCLRSRSAERTRLSHRPTRRK